MFKLPVYNAPDFSAEPFLSAKAVLTAKVEMDAVAPEGFYATTVFPEYFLLNGEWRLIDDGRMDCAAVLKDGGVFAVEPRGLKAGDEVVMGEGLIEEGIFINADCFGKNEGEDEVFSFRKNRSRESSFSSSYSELVDILKHDRDSGFIVWVLGPAVVFDASARKALAGLISAGYAHAVFGGNAVATHDLEAALFGTALGQRVDTGESVRNGHRHHLYTIGRVRAHGSIENAVNELNILDGVVAACVRNGVPLILAGSIRDDGPLPGVIASVYDAQDAMREYTKKATAVISVATQLHSIAVGNMTPCYIRSNGTLRPVYFRAVDSSEFVINKLCDRGSITSEGFVTNAQDFLKNLSKELISHENR